MKNKRLTNNPSISSANTSLNVFVDACLGINAVASGLASINAHTHNATTLHIPFSAQDETVYSTVSSMSPDGAMIITADNRPNINRLTVKYSGTITTIVVSQSIPNVYLPMVLKQLFKIKGFRDYLSLPKRRRKVHLSKNDADLLIRWIDNRAKPMERRLESWFNNSLAAAS